MHPNTPPGLSEPPTETTLSTGGKACLADSEACEVSRFATAASGFCGSVFRCRTNRLMKLFLGFEEDLWD